MATLDAFARLRAIEGAGLSEFAQQWLMLSADTTTDEQFNAHTTRARELQALAKIVRLGDDFDMQGAVDSHIVRAVPVADFRRDMINAMAEADQDVSTARKIDGLAVSSSSTLQARQEQIAHIVAQRYRRV